jgi:hypothetical protein
LGSLKWCHSGGRFVTSPCAAATETSAKDLRKVLGIVCGDQQAWRMDGLQGKWQDFCNELHGELGECNTRFQGVQILKENSGSLLAD